MGEQDKSKESMRSVPKVKKIQPNSVITNSMGPLVFVRYNRDIVITVKVYVVK